jgi:DNA repair exonuclease SbcCD ATPase subunit
MPTKIELPPAKSFEEIWAIIQETDRLIKESAAEADRRFKETEKLMKENAAEADKRFKETEKLMKENAAEADKRFKETEKLMKENAAEADKRFKETEKQLKESSEWRKEIEKLMKENDKQLKENAAEADRRFKETDKLLKETGRQLGDVHNRLGELVEHIIVPNILEKVKPLGYKFKYVRKRCEFTDKNLRVIAEADIVLVNGEYIMIIEVKTVLKVKDVDNHLKRLEKIRRDACPPDESHKLIGCVAGAVVDEAVKRHAHKKGLYVLEQSGDTLKLDIPEGFNPKIW